MIFISLIISISPIEIFNITCGSDQALNLYNNQCYTFPKCTSGIMYNQTRVRCADSGECSDTKCYQFGGIKYTYDGLNPISRCFYSGYQDMESCQQLINEWSTDYFVSSNLLNQVSCPGCPNQNDFFNYLRYERSYEIEADQNVPIDFRFSTVFTFILSRFALNGTFLGFKEVDTDLNLCDEKNDISQIWRRYGTNFYSECKFNLPVLNDTKPNEFYNIYLLYNDAEGQHIIEVPVLIRNYGRNSRADSSNYALFKRFFIKFSNSSIIKYAENMTLQIEIDPSNSRRIRVPQLIINYSTSTYNTGEHPDFADINFDKRTATIKDFYFSVVYLRSLSSFWKVNIGILIAFLLLGLFFWVFKLVVYAKFHKDDNTMGPYAIASFCGIFGTSLTLVIFIVTFRVFIIYKAQKQGYFCLPPEKEFWIITPFVWISFALMCISSIIHIILQSRANVIILDWENRPEKGGPISAWRRIMIANEYNRLMLKRTYSLEIVLCLYLFIVEGFNLTLLASPVPRTDLVNVGKTYKVLHFAFTSLLWLLLLAASYIIDYLRSLIRCKTSFFEVGNPYANFNDLCTATNCSVFIMNTESQGYLIQRQYAYEHTDVNIKKLNENLLSETAGQALLSGITDNRKIQVFHVYLEDDLASILYGISEELLRGMDRLALEQSQTNNIPIRKEVAEMDAYKSLNKCLCRFFAADECSKTYITKKNGLFARWIENYLGFGPTVGKESILTVQNFNAYRQSLLGGIELTLYVMYLLLFAGIEMEKKSPAIAAFSVYIIDKFFLTIYAYLSKHNFARKSIIDRHYIIT